MIDWKNPFKPEDFNGCWHRSKAIAYQDIAQRANELLRRNIEQCPVILVRPDTGGGFHCCDTAGPDTHKARLICIKEIK